MSTARLGGRAPAAVGDEDRRLAARVVPGAEPLAVLLLAPSARSRSLDGRT